MSAKIAKVMNEIDRTKGKISEFQSKLRELEKQKTELENLQIVDVVRGMDISFADLAEMLKMARERSPATSGQVGPKSKAVPTAPDTNTDTEQEDSEE